MIGKIIYSTIVVCGQLGTSGCTSFSRTTRFRWECQIALGPFEIYGNLISFSGIVSFMDDILTSSSHHTVRLLSGDSSSATLQCSDRGSSATVENVVSVTILKQPDPQPSSVDYEHEKSRQLRERKIDGIYEKYVFPTNPTLLDYICLLPHGIHHSLKNLSGAFGWKFIVMVISIYGFQVNILEFDLNIFKRILARIM